MKDLVCGVGIYESGRYVSTVRGKQTREYCLWTSMLHRCYSEKKLNRSPTYRGCTVSDSFKNFQFFAQWCNTQRGFGEVGFELDKDLLSPKNKLYSEHTCVFLPRLLNGTISATLKGKLGVSYNKENRNFTAISITAGIYKDLGLFESEQDALDACRIYKENSIRVLAKDYKGLIDDKAYLTLINFSVPTIKASLRKHNYYVLGESEAWVKDATGRYLVREDGTVHSVRRNKLFQLKGGKPKSSKRDKLCQMVTIRYQDGVVEGKYVHRLVAEAFIPNPHNHPFVKHLDGNTDNNEVSNLGWFSRKY